MATYAQIIEQSVKDFNAIFTALSNKSVYWAPASKNTLALIPSTNTHSGNLGTTDLEINSGIATADYAGLITNQLFRVSGVTNPTDITAPDGVISKRNSESVTTASITASGIELTIAGGAYYDTNSTITLSNISTVATSLTVEDGVSSTGGSFTTDINSNYYTLTATNNKLISSAQIDKGSITTTVAVSSDTLAASANVAIDTGDTGNISATIGNSAGSDYHLKIIASPSVTGDLEITNTNTLVAGYITAVSSGSTTTDTYEFPSNSLTSSNLYVNIPRATVSGITGSGTVSFNVPNAITTGDSSDVGYYQITATPEVIVNTTGATITSGYITAADGFSVSGVNTNTPSSIYIKNGSVPDYTASDATITATGVSSEGILASGIASNHLYTINLASSKIDTATIDTGYITDTSYAVNVSGSGSIVIAEGSVASVSATNTLTKTTDTSNALETVANGMPSVTFSATSSTTGGTITEGYVRGGTVSVTGGSTAATGTYYVKAGSVTIAGTLSTSLTDVTTDANDETSDEAEIFLNTNAGLTGDYYTITPNGSITSSSPGWINSNSQITISNGSPLYLPKAVLSWTQGIAGAEDQLMVTTGGYLPAGEIKDITTFDFSQNAASVGLAYSNDFATAASGNYTITVSKNGSSTVPGYISTNTGALLNNTITVNRGSVAVTATGSNSITLSATPVADNDTYVFSGSDNVPVDVSVTTGYIKQSDVTGLESGQTYKNVSVTGSLTLPKGTISVASGSYVTLGAYGTGNTVSVSGSATDYYVIPSVTSGSVSATGTPGYLAAGDFGSLSLSVSNNTTIDKIYITAGTELTTVGNTATDNQTTLSGALDSSTGTYTVSSASYTIPVSGTLTEGYYGSTITGVSGAATVAAKSMTIPAASATIAKGSGNDVNTITGDNGVVLYSDHTNLSSYITISASASTVVNATSVSAGYLSSTSQIGTNGSVSITGINGTKYIEKFNGTNLTITNASTDPEIIAASNNASVTFATDEKYVASDLTATIGADAMGTNVAAELTKLKERLAGTYTVVQS